MQLEEIVAATADIASTASRTAKLARIAAVLAALEDTELPVGVALLSGHPRQDRLEVGWATSSRSTAPAATTSSLTLLDVDASFEAIADQSGDGSTGEREALLVELLGRATHAEQRFLREVLQRNVRKGAGRGLLLRALADLTNVDHEDLRRAAAVSGDVAHVAAVARSAGAAAVRTIELEVGRPFDPMLAQTASSLDDDSIAGPSVIEQKLDGIRVQVHRDGDLVRIFTRNRNEVTPRMPELIEIARRRLPWSNVILDGEAIILADDGRPVMFQESMQRFGTEGSAPSALPLSVRFFDVLAADGQLLYRTPLADRLATLDDLDAELRVDRLLTEDPAAAKAFLRSVLAAGHEGVVLKDPTMPYEPGVRSSNWRKFKPAHTLDLVVLAAEWGSGRRRGWLSNLHLGARDTDGGFVMLGKTFKGLTDEMLAWQTERLQQLETEPGPDHHVDRQRRPVFVTPSLVVEVAFDGLQVSRRYPAGLALRFARVKAHRPDKRAEEADTIETVRAIFEGRRLPEVP